MMVLLLAPVLHLAPPPVVEVVGTIKKLFKDIVWKHGREGEE